jgi:hypothetical protein
MIVLALVLGGCGLSSYELFPPDGGTDAGARADDAGGPPLRCFDGLDCSGCPVPECTSPCTATCQAACSPATACSFALGEGAPEGVSCNRESACGLSGGVAFSVCTGRVRDCIVNAMTGPSEIECLRGRCRVTCDRACMVSCPSGSCDLVCNTEEDCRIVSCPTTVMTCPGRITSCGPCPS